MPILGELSSIFASILGDGPEVIEPWAEDEQKFEEHFDCTYSDFAEAVAGLHREEDDLYRKTMKVNPEAAVLWVLHGS